MPPREKCRANELLPAAATLECARLALMEKQQVLNTIRKKHAQSNNKTTEDATQTHTHMYMHALHAYLHSIFICKDSNVNVSMRVCVSLSLYLYLYVCFGGRAQKIACTIVVVVFHSLCCVAVVFVVVAAAVVSPKGNARIPVFFGVCFVSAVPLRASEIAREIERQVPFEKLTKNEKTKQHKINFEVNAHFTFLLLSTSCVVVFAKAKFV